MSGVWVVIEHRDLRIGRISWEAVAAGQKLAAQQSLPVNALVIGAQTDSIAAEAAAKALAKVVRIEHALLTRYTADGFSLALQQFFAQEKPDFVVFPHTYQVRDYAPALAARLGQVLISDVVGIEAGPLFTPPAHAGPLERQLQPYRYRSMPHLGPGRRLSCRSSRHRPSRNLYLRPHHWSRADSHTPQRAFPRFGANRRPRLRAIHRKHRPWHQGRRKPPAGPGTR